MGLKIDFSGGSDNATGIQYEDTFDEAFQRIQAPGGTTNPSTNFILIGVNHATPTNEIQSMIEKARVAILNWWGDRNR